MVACHETRLWAECLATKARHTIAFDKAAVDIVDDERAMLQQGKSACLWGHWHNSSRQSGGKVKVNGRILTAADQAAHLQRLDCCSADR